MKERSLIRPLEKSAPTPQVRPEATRLKPPTEGAAEVEAAISAIKPEMQSAAEASLKAEELANNLSKVGQRGLDAVKAIDRARLEKLLSDD